MHYLLVVVTAISLMAFILLLVAVISPDIQASKIELALLVDLMIVIIAILGALMTRLTVIAIASTVISSGSIVLAIKTIIRARRHIPEAPSTQKDQ